MTYRSDIDGLRSFAVLSVLFFHINAHIMPGGFTGVDVFFVISGFLITSILLKEIEETSRVNIKEFYRRRIKRILPSFFLVAALSSIVAYLFLLPEDLVNFAKSLRAGLTFASNHYFADKDNYFDPSSDEFPLLHTWSLAVEEQFYFLWPILLFWLLKIKSKKNISLIILGTIIGSTVLAQYLSADPSTSQRSYFFLFTRMGELLIGCWTAFIVRKEMFKPTENWSKVLSFVGMGGMIASFYVISKTSIFPGYWALLPCISAALIIWTGYYYQNPVHKFLSLKPLVWVGLHSYALYLWHWPILAFYRYLTGTTDLGLTEGAIVTASAFGLSYVSRKLIENPCNHTKLPFKQVSIRYFLVPSAAALAVALTFIKTEGLPTRIKDPTERNFILSRVTPTHKCHSNYKTDCWNKDDPKAPKAVIFGDSHGAHFTPFVREVFSDYNIYAKTASSCPPILKPSEQQKEDMRKFSKKMCIFSVEQVQRIIETEDIKIVFLAANWRAYDSKWRVMKESVKDTINQLLKKNIKVFFIEEVPAFDTRAIMTYYRRNFGPADLILSNTSNNFQSYASEQTYKDVAISTGAKVLKAFQPDILPEFKMPFYKKILIYRDGHHLTKEGSLILGRHMKEHILVEINTSDISK